MILLSLLLTGCSSCPEGEALDISDRRGRLTDAETDTLQETYARVRDAMGPNGVCLSGARVTAGEDTSLRDRKLLLGADDPEPEAAVEWAMCEVMGEERGYNDGSLEWFGPDARHMFETICRLGPPNVDWIDAIQTACDGADELDGRDRFMYEEVYPGVAAGRVDGDLPATVGGEVVFDDLIPPDMYGYEFAQAGEHLLFLLTPRGDAEAAPGDPLGDARLLRLDPADGSHAAIWEGPWTEDSWGLLAGGEEAGALYFGEWNADGATIVRVDGEGEVSTITTDADLSNSSQKRRAASATRLWLGPYTTQSGPLLWVDLSDGGHGEVPLPELEVEGPDLLVSSLQATSDGVVAELLDTVVHDETHAVTIGVYGYIHARLDLGSETWTELTRGLHLLDAGLHDGRYLIGSVYSEAGRAVAAYDIEADALLISDDACLIDSGYPFIAAGDTLFTGRSSGDGEDTIYTLAPLTLSPGG